VQVQELKLEDIVQEEKNEPPPPPPPKPPEPPKVEMAKFTPPKVVKDEEVKEEEKPPEVEKLEDTKIGTSNQEGIKDEGIVAPPVDQGGVVEAPKSDDEDKVFQKVEIDAEFPGGTSAWFKYVQREIERNIDELQDDGKSGTVVVLFIVDKEGGVSDVRAMPCSEAGVAKCLGAGSKLAEVAVNAIKKGPKWKPAVQNGRNVKAYRRQPVTFKLEEE
jgi:protein TonB